MNITVLFDEEHKEISKEVADALRAQKHVVNTTVGKRTIFGPRDVILTDSEDTRALAEARFSPAKVIYVPIGRGVKGVLRHFQASLQAL